MRETSLSSSSSSRDSDNNRTRSNAYEKTHREIYAQRGCASRGDTARRRRRDTEQQNLTRSTQSRRRRGRRGRGRDEGSRGASKHACTQAESVRFVSREMETKSSSPASRRLLKRASGPNFEALVTPMSKVRVMNRHVRVCERSRPTTHPSKLMNELCDFRLQRTSSTVQHARGRGGSDAGSGVKRPVFVFVFLVVVVE